MQNCNSIEDSEFGFGVHEDGSRMSEPLLSRETDQSSETDLALFDRACFRGIIRLSGTGPNASQRLNTALRVRGGLCRSEAIKGGGLTFKIEQTLDDGSKAECKVALRSADIHDGLIITSGSAIEMNLQRLLRAKHGIPDEHVALDRRRNFTKPTAQCDMDDLILQIDAMRNCVQAVRDQIIQTFPCCVLEESRLWLSSGEICHDLECENAAAIVRATCKVPPVGSRESWQTEYECTTGAGRSPTWHFRTHKRGPIIKGYLKTESVARIEAQCPNREAVVRCVGKRTEAMFNGDGAAELAVEFYHAAGELCCAALDHVRHVAASCKTPLDLRLALEPLHAIVEGRREGTGYTPGEQARRQAARVLIDLNDSGMTHFVGMRRGTKVRDTLERLAGPGGPLVRGATNGIFCIAPEFGLAVSNGT